VTVRQSHRDFDAKRQNLRIWISCHEHIPAEDFIRENECLPGEEKKRGASHLRQCHLTSRRLNGVRRFDRFSWTTLNVDLIENF